MHATRLELVRTLCLVIVAAMVLGGCAQADTPTSTPDETPATVSDDANAQGLPSTTTEPTADQTPRSSVSSGTTRSVDKTPEPVPSQTDTTAVTGEVPPDLIAVVMADLVSRSGIAEAGISVVRSEQVVWNDGSLGCPLPGETYTQALVDGYWIVLEAGDITYDYRAAATGYFKLCTGGGVPLTQPTG